MLRINLASVNRQICILIALIFDVILTYIKCHMISLITISIFVSEIFALKSKALTQVIVFIILVL